MKRAPNDSESLLRAAADKLRAAIEGLETHGDGEHDSTVKNLARITTAIATIVGEQRQHEKALLRQVADLPLDQVVAYLRTLPELDREQIARSLTGDDSHESLL